MISCQAVGGLNTFMMERGDYPATGTRYQSLREQGPEKQGPFGPAAMYYLLRSPSAYSLSYTPVEGCRGRARRVLFGGRFYRAYPMKTGRQQPSEVDR